jgi:O-Antigen ligase
MGTGVAIADRTRAGRMPAMVDAPPEAASPRPEPQHPAVTALMLLPGALVVFMGFNAGGFFPNAPALAVIVLAQVLLLRIVRAQRPFDGIAPAALIAVGALALYAALTLASALWSHSAGRALIEFHRVCLYLLALVLFATVRATASNLRWLLRGLALGTSVVCLAGLISRVAPDVWHTAPDVANERLSYPVTYWNALGLLAALGIILSFHLTCTLRELRPVRVLAAAALPLLAATLFFTFSRGAIAAGAIALVVYMVVARPKALLSGVLATWPATAALILIAYHANLLDTVDPTTPAAISQGHRVAVAAGVCAAVSAGLRLLLENKLDPRLRRTTGRPWMSRGTRIGLIWCAAASAIAVALALGAPRALEHDWSRFLSGAAPHGNQGDLRQRLTDPSNNGRSELWKVALRGFSSAPVEGRGAGMYQTLWDRQRPRFAYTVNAHSLYLEAMAELGLAGLVALALLVGAVLWGLAARARGPRRSVYGVLLASAVLWALHAGVDWDWEMPVITLPFFAIAGVALSPRSARTRGDSTQPSWIPGRTGRAVIAAACVAAMVLPVLVIGSQSRLAEAEHALYTSNCAKASSEAQSSSGWLSARPEPYEILGFCDIQRGQAAQAVTEMQKALSRDPGSWERYYTLAIAQAAAGIDPRPAALRALQMNPLEPLTAQAARALGGSSRASWVRAARSVRDAALASNHISIAPA